MKNRSGITFRNSACSLTHNESGTTLIELIVAMAIMAIIIAVVVPLWNRYSQNQQIKSHADRLTELLQKARSMAMNSEKGELITDSNVNVIGYYVYAPAAPNLIDPDLPPPGGLTTFSLMRLSQNKTTLVYTKTALESITLTNSIRLYRGQTTLIDSVMYTLPFGKSKFYTGEPDTGTLATNNTGCSNNSDNCAIYFIQKLYRDDFYFRIEATEEGVVLNENQP